MSVRRSVCHFLKGRDVKRNFIIYLFILGERLSLSEQDLWDSLHHSTTSSGQRRRASSQNRAPPRRGDVVSPALSVTSVGPTNLTARERASGLPEPAPLYVSSQPRSRKPILYSSAPSVHVQQQPSSSPVPSLQPPVQAGQRRPGVVSVQVQQQAAQPVSEHTKSR